MIPASEALKKLEDGNRRFAAGRRDDLPTGPAERAELTRGQRPFAIILGCSDSRVPAELVFNQGLGDLFVIRVAGNIVAPSQVGSIEFAAAEFGTQLVVVLGHSHCGAVTATLDALTHPDTDRSPNLGSIVNRIRPAVETLVETQPERRPQDLMAHAVRANVRASVQQLRQGSSVLENLIQHGRLAVVGAEYSLKTGVVEFFNRPSQESPDD